MKVGELRKKLAKFKKEELIRLSVELYKIVPKVKKEDYQIDALINNPKIKSDKKKSITKLSLETIEQDVYKFIEDAKQYFYNSSNDIIAKKERSNWRFKVMRWYKELINIKRTDADVNKQSQVLSDVYELLCQSCEYSYFSSWDSFQSIGVDQSDFYRSVIVLIQEAKGKGDSVEKGIRLIVDNNLNRETLFSSLMIVLISTLDVPDLKEKGIEIVKKLLVEHKDEKNISESNSSWSSSNKKYRYQEKNRNLSELGYRFHSSLFEYEEGVNFFNANYSEKDEEIRLYILVRLLFEEKKKELIKIEIEKCMEKGIEPRSGLLDLLKIIKDKDKLPDYY